MAIARVGASGQPIPMGGIGDILEGTGRYMGPGHLIPPAIGGGSAWGLQALWNKITGGEDETEEEIDINDDDIFTQEEKDLLNELPPGLRESTGKNLKKQKEKLLSVTEEEREGLKELLKKVREDLRNEESFSEDIIDSAADAIIESSLKKMEEGLSKKQAIAEAWKEVYKTLTGGGLTKQARGGLVGINELTRGL